jgi:hypothetical protein
LRGLAPMRLSVCVCLFFSFCCCVHQQHRAAAQRSFGAFTIYQLKWGNKQKYWSSRLPFSPPPPHRPSCVVKIFIKIIYYILPALLLLIYSLHPAFALPVVTWNKKIERERYFSTSPRYIM